MELGRFLIYLTLLVLTVTQCSDARHSMERRDVGSETDYDELADEADGSPNSTDSGDEAESSKIPLAEIESKPTVYETKVGQSVQLECNVSSIYTVVSWYKDNVLYFMNNMSLSKLPRYTIARDTKDLLITDVQPEDAGVYRCELAQNGLPSVNHTLIVLQPPKVINFTATDDGNVVEGANVTLTCEVDGVPRPQIVWSRGDATGANKRLQEEDGEFFANGVVITSIKPEQAGNYYCYIFNKVGYNQSELKLNVFKKPRVHVHKTVVNSAIGVEAVLQCTVHDESEPHIRWYKDNTLIEDTSSRFTVSTYGAHSNLTVTPAADQDFGTFTCEAQNRHGKHDRSIELVESPIIEDLEVDGPKLSWRVLSHQPLEEVEVQLMKMGGEGEWHRLIVPVPAEKHHEYSMEYQVAGEQVDAGKYQAVVKVKNTKSWATSQDEAVLDIEVEAQSIQHASVFGGNSAGRPTMAAITTVLMYLLVRMA